MSIKIDPLAKVHPNAQLGERVSIGPFTYIAEDVTIGDDTYIAPNVTILDGARIGKNCRIFPGAVISAIPQDLKFNGEYTTVEIGDNVTIRECVTINRATVYNYRTQIGNNVLLMAYVHVAHDCIIHDNVVLANAVNMAGHVEIHEFAVIGGMVAIHQFSKIGKHAMVAGASKVRKDVPPYVLAGRDPLCYKGINVIGLRRRGFSQEQINEIQELYKMLYFEKLNISDALKNIAKKKPTSIFFQEIETFIQQSGRGIIPAYQRNNSPTSNNEFL